jgi:hypothetical protein
LDSTPGSKVNGLSFFSIRRAWSQEFLAFSKAGSLSLC